MRQLIIQKDWEKETMIIMKDDKKIVFLKDENNKNSDEKKLYDDISSLLSNYLNK